MKFPVKGQVKKNQEIGMFIVEACRHPENDIFIEIGTWKGLGSTLIFLEALNKRVSPFYFYSLESNFEFYGEAKKNLNKKTRKVNNFFLVYGYVSDPNNLNISSLSHEEERWYSEDAENYKNAPSVRHLIPKKINVLLLDGGEFSSLSEFLFLQSHLADKATIILDDIHVRKNKYVLELMIQDPRYKIEKTSSERNGTALVKFFQE